MALCGIISGQIENTLISRGIEKMAEIKPLL